MGFFLEKPDYSGARKRAKASVLRLWERIKKEVRARDGERCRVCSIPTRDVHHIKARSLGGKHTTENCCCVCFRCHRDIHEGRLKLTGNANDTLRTWRP